MPFPFSKTLPADDLAAVGFLEPRQEDRGVQTAGIRQNNFLHGTARLSLMLDLVDKTKAPPVPVARMLWEPAGAPWQNSDPYYSPKFRSRPQTQEARFRRQAWWTGGRG